MTAEHVATTVIPSGCCHFATREGRPRVYGPWASAAASTTPHRRTRRVVRRRPKRPSPVLPTRSCNKTPISGGGSKTASIPEQLPAIMPEVPAVPPEIHPIMMNVRQVSTDICPTAESQITTKIAPIPPQVSAVPPQIKAVGLQVLSIQVLSIGTDVSTVTISIPIGRSNRRGEAHAADGSRDSQDNHTLAHHNLLLLLAPPVRQCRSCPVCPEPHMCSGFILGSFM